MADDRILDLEKYGDPLEQEICRHVDQLRVVLQPYTEVWFNHIVVRRIKDNSCVEEAWMNFAGSHYSAILRVFHAYRSLNVLNNYALREVTKDDLGVFLLDVHREWASFWENIGSAIDNLALAFQDSIPPMIKDDARDVLTDKYEDLGYAYDRRTQFIHSRIVPASSRDGLLTFRVRTTDRTHRHLEPKETNWDLPYDKELAIGDVLPEEWNKFLVAMSNAWYWLVSELRSKDQSRPKAVEKSFPNRSPAESQRTLARNRENHGVTDRDLPSVLSAPPPSGTPPR